MKPFFCISILLLFPFLSLKAQTKGQNIRGLVINPETQKPIPRVLVELLDVQPKRVVETDSLGQFLLTDISLGRRRLLLIHEAHHNLFVPDLELIAGKELYLNLEMKPLSQAQLKEIVIETKAKKSTKDLPINQMALMGIRSFSIEEVKRYSGARNDPARLAANFAGVSNLDDSQNDIIVRGNSPLFIQWRLEGLPIPSPNYFSITGTSGGPLPLLNVNLLRNSDFLNGAFPAEYGNVLGAVFDIGLRAGNPNRFEGLAQVGITGLELNLEGPLSNKKKHSFILGYRYSVLGLFQRIGAPLGTTTIPDFQDLSFKLDFEQGRWGKWSFYGMGGLAKITFLAQERDSTDLFWRANLDNYLSVGMGSTGLSHRLDLGQGLALQSHFNLAANYDRSHRDSVSSDFTQKFPYFKYEHLTLMTSLSSQLNWRKGLNYFSRTGFFLTNYYLNYLDHDLIRDIKFRDFRGSMQLGQLFTQHNWRFAYRWQAQFGLQAQWFSLNNQWALGPRLALTTEPWPNHRFGLGLSLQQQIQAFNIYLNQSPLADGSFRQSNRNLGFTQALHGVFSYDWAIADNWRLKWEAYAQYLFDVPVSESDSSFTMLNSGYEILLPLQADLINRGLGRQVGTELTLEKFFDRGFYGLLTAAFFQAQAQALDGIWRNTRFNNQYINRLLLGKEFRFGLEQRQAWTIDTRFTWAGGGFYTPIDLLSSRQLGYQVLAVEQPQSARFRPYWRWDLKLGFHLNNRRKQLSHRFYLDMLNVLGTKNVFNVQYDPQRGEVLEVLQLGFFPDFQYKVNFGWAAPTGPKDL